MAETPSALDVKVSPVLIKNLESTKKIKVNEGGTGSGKTYSILMILIFFKALKTKGKVFTICRQRYQDMRDSVMLDFIKILKDYNLYEEKNHARTHPMTYTLNGNLFQFIGMDTGHKMRSARRDYLYMNEGDAITKENWVQLSMRTREEIYIDYNPSFTEHDWLDQVIAREDCEFIHSTYLDNYDFLSQGEIDEIDRLCEIDEYYDKVYRLGLRAAIQGQIYSKWEMVPREEWPQDFKKGPFIGLDFGFTNDPTAIIEAGLADGRIWVRELTYATGLKNDDIADRLRGTRTLIIADSAEPKSIAEIGSHGYRIKAAKKGPDSIKNGIDILQRRPMMVHEDSSNVKKELSNYKWSTKRSGERENKPVDKFNHAMDAIRYIALAKFRLSGGGGRASYGKSQRQAATNQK